MNAPSSNTSSPIKTVLFDLDGTLVDSLQFTFDAFNHGLTSLGGPALDPIEIMKHFGAGELVIFSKLIGENDAEHAYTAYRTYVETRVGEVPLHPGALDLLNEIKALGLPTAIVTGRGSQTTEMILKHHGLEERFVTVVADDHVGHSKPSPEGIELALSRIGLPAENAVYLGDTWVDVKAARSAGAYAIGALWDRIAKRELLEEYEPHYLAQTPGEALDWIKARL